MTDKKDLSRAETPGAPAASSPAAAIDAFVSSARKIGPSATAEARGRLVFALDATMSRQPTWDLACKVQAQMFEAADKVGGLAVQLVYFRGFDECRASRWVIAPSALTKLMTQIDCRGGQTQIGRVLRHVRNEARSTGVKALVYVGDAMEEPVDALCAAAGELALLGVKAFMFQEGPDAVAGNAFKEIARLTGGAYARFDANAPSSLAALLRAAAAYASGGVDALNRLARAMRDARKLLTAMRGPMITLLYGVAAARRPVVAVAALRRREPGRSGEAAEAGRRRRWRSRRGGASRHARPLRHGAACSAASAPGSSAGAASAFPGSAEPHRRRAPARCRGCARP